MTLSADGASVSRLPTSGTVSTDGDCAGPGCSRCLRPGHGEQPGPRVVRPYSVRAEPKLQASSVVKTMIGDRIRVRAVKMWCITVCDERRSGWLVARV